MNERKVGLVNVAELENEYIQLLKVVFADISTNRRSKAWRFVVDENFNVYITSFFHEHLQNYGVDLGRTLTEGYIFFDDTGKIETIRFKYRIYEGRLTTKFKEGSNDLTKLQQATRKLIEKALYQ